MKLRWFGFALVLMSLTTLGCESSDFAGEAGEAAKAPDSDSQPAAAPRVDAAEVALIGAPTPPALAADGLTPVAVESNAVALTPATAQVNFIGTHSPPRNPDPRHGGFGKFQGKIEVDPATKLPTSITIQIETPSLRIYPEPSGLPAMMTPQLSNHLKSPDFLDVNNIPTMKFTSSRIAPSTDKPGEATVTLHDVTKEISFPVKVGMGDSGFTLTSQFEINRLDYQINFDPKQVVETVAIDVVVGKVTPDAP